MTEKSKAIYPGSFDPVTRGHLDVIERARGLFDTLHIAVLSNPEKKSLFTPEERIELLRSETAGLAGAGVLEFSSFEGLTARLAAEVEAGWIVRGLRSAADAAYELPMAHSNRRCGDAEIETVFLPAGAGTSFISSSLVREIAAGGGRLEAFVTPGVEAALRGKSSS